MNICAHLHAQSLEISWSILKICAHNVMHIFKISLCIMKSLYNYVQIVMHIRLRYHGVFFKLVHTCMHTLLPSFQNRQWYLHGLCNYGAIVCTVACTCSSDTIVEFAKCLKMCRSKQSDTIEEWCRLRRSSAEGGPDTIEDYAFEIIIHDGILRVGGMGGAPWSFFWLDLLRLWSLW